MRTICFVPPAVLRWAVTRGRLLLETLRFDDASSRPRSFINGPRYEKWALLSVSDRDDVPSVGWKARGKRLVTILLPLTLIGAGLVLSILASMSVLELVGEETRGGMAVPGDTFQSLNRTDYGAVVLASESIPCPLLIHPLTDSEHEDYLRGRGLPPRVLNCDRLSVTVGQQVSHLLVRNVDPVEPMNYTVHLTFFKSTQPLAWISLPALGLLLVGSVIVVFRLLVRGIERVAKELEEKQP